MIVVSAFGAVMKICFAGRKYQILDRLENGSVRFVVMRLARTWLESVGLE